MLEAHFCGESLEALKDCGIKEVDKELYKSKFNEEPKHLVLGIIEESNSKDVDINQFNIPLEKLPKNKLLFSYHRFFTKSNDKIKNYLYTEDTALPTVSAIVIDYEDLVRLVNKL